MLVKIERERINASNNMIEVYNIYEGIRRILLPFLIKWYPVKIMLSEKECCNYINKSYIPVKGVKIITTVK
jgi:hypothetical protein